MLSNRIWLLTAFLIPLSWSCGTREIKPADIYPEDICSSCKMAFSDQRFAAEIVTYRSEVFKFDDIGCLDRFRSGIPDRDIAAVYYKDFDTRQWLSADRATVVKTGVITPMGSGKLAFADSVRAREFGSLHPASGAEK